MTETVKVLMTTSGKELIFTKAVDGWWESELGTLAINPDLTHCTTDPWYGDMWCDAPKHLFTLLEK